MARLVTMAPSETAASLDGLADPGPELVAAAARLLDELGTSFGIAEMGQLTQDGAIRQRYWTDARPLLNWAQHFGVEVTNRQSRAHSKLRAFWQGTRSR